MELSQRLRLWAERLEERPSQQVRDLARAREAFATSKSGNLFFGVHESWEAAQTQARAFGAVGYDHPSTVTLYESRVRKDEHDFPSLYWIERSMHEGLRSVFDIGGNIGIKYLAFKEALAEFQDLRWCTQDVPAVAEHGRELARKRGTDPGLSFTSDIHGGDGFDVLLASGVLQYLPWTLGDILKTWQRLPRRLVINTTAIHPEREYFTVNNIWTAFCPYRVQTQASLVRGLAGLGYRVRETWINPAKPLVIPGHPDLSLGHYTGLCLDLR